MNVEVNVKDRVLKPVHEVFAAIVDPSKMSRFFISSGSATMKAGTTVEWVFADVGGRLAVDVIEVEENRRIAFDWTASGTTARVTIKLEPADSSGATIVIINEARWPFDREGVDRALRQTAGWTDFLCCMKAYLQHGINLRLGRSKDDH